jgi:tryptophan-rich sensory protein
VSSTGPSVGTQDRLAADTVPAGERPRSRLVAAGALVGFIALAQLAGLIGIPFTDRATGGWYDQLDRPWFNPPNWVFGPVWTTLYVLIGVAAWRVWRSADASGRTTALEWWAVQLVLNAAWTPLFFGARALWVAAIEIVVLWVAIVCTIGAFRRLDTVAAWLMVPYLAWVSFAAVLNISIALMN